MTQKNHYEAIDKSLNDVSDAIGETLGRSIDAEAAQTEQMRNIENLWGEIRAREGSYSKNRASLIKIQTELEENKSVFSNDYKNAIENLDKQINDFTTQSTVLEDRNYHNMQKMGAIQETLKNTRAKLNEMNELEIKYKQQLFSADQILDRVRILAPDDGISSLRTQLTMLKSKVDESTKESDDYLERVHSLESQSIQNEGEIRRLRDKKDNLDKKIDTEKETFRVERKSKKRQSEQLNNQKDLYTQRSKDYTKQKHDLTVRKDRLQTMIEHSDALFQGKVDEAMITKSSIASKRNEMKAIERERKENEERILEYQKMRMTKQKELEKEIRRTKDEKQEALSEYRQAKENILICSAKAERLTEKTARMTEGLGECITEEAKLDKAEKIINKCLNAADNIIAKRRDGLEQLIDTLNDLHRKVSAAKRESDQLSRAEAITFTPLLFDRENNYELIEKLKKQKKTNKKYKKAVKYMEERINSLGAQTMITKTRTTQLQNARKCLDLELRMNNVYSTLEQKIQDTKERIEKKKKVINNAQRDNIINPYNNAYSNENDPILDAIQEEIATWRNASGEEATELICLWGDKVKKFIEFHGKK